MSAIKLQLPRSGLLEQMSAHYSQPLARLESVTPTLASRKKIWKTSELQYPQVVGNTRTRLFLRTRI